MRAVIGGCLVAATLATSPAHGDTAQGDRIWASNALAALSLEQYSREHEEGVEGYHVGYVQGVVDTLERDSDYCPPKKLIMSQDVILQAFELGTRQSHDAYMSGTGVPYDVPDVILWGLRELFPCN